MPKLKKQNKTIYTCLNKNAKVKKKKLDISEKNKLKECGVKELIKIKEVIYTEI